MKLVDIVGGRVPVSNEESKLLGRINKQPTNFDSLSDKDKELVYKLHFRNIVNITDKGDITIKSKPSLVDIK